MQSQLPRTILQVLFLLGAILLWEWGVGMSGSKVIPRPSAVAQASIEMAQHGVILLDLQDSLRRVLIGVSIASVSGIALGFAMGSLALVNTAVSPIIEFLRPIPPIAWIPLAITLFGLGDESACFVIFIGAFYPVLTNTILGVREVPSIYLDAARTLGCSPWRRFTEIIWPSALPSIFAGLRVGLGFGWMCVVAAEMVAASSGLGYEIQLNRQLLHLDRVVVGMAVIGIIGYLMNRFLWRMERRMIPWKQWSSGKDDVVVAEDEALELVGKEVKEQATAQTELPSHKIKGASVGLDHIVFSHVGGAKIMTGDNFKIEAGEVFCLLGPSGCGKTTLLRIAAGLLKPGAGEVLIDGENLSKHQNEVTMAFQNSALFPWKTALENVIFAIESRNEGKLRDKQDGGKREDDGDEQDGGKQQPDGKVQAGSPRAEAMQYLTFVGLPNKAASYPHQLSGGQQQRVALARALAYRPRVLLMDEPFAALDSQTREAMQEYVSAILHSTGITVIFVTHDIREAVFLADRVGVMSRNGGRLIGVERVDKSQPRDDGFRYTSDFGTARLTLWNLMKESSSKS